MGRRSDGTQDSSGPRSRLVLRLALGAVVIGGVAVATHAVDGAGSPRVVSRAAPHRTLRQLVADQALAPTAQALDAAAPSTIVQFPLFPSGVKTKFPKATGVVTVVQGADEVSLFDTVTVDVSNMPPDTTFTVFFIEHATKPFGHVEYVADVHTDANGSGDATFEAITLVAMALDSDNPETSKDQSGDASGIQLEHLGMWFSNIDDAKKQLGDDTLKGTPFDGANPPLHAGPQAMTDNQTDPVF